MRRLVSWSALMAAVLVTTAGTSDAANGPAGVVTSVEIVSASGSTDVMIAVDSDIRVADATLAGPDRIYFDLSPARLALSPRPYDGVSRGGIVDVRYSQKDDSTVRVTLVTETKRAYRVTRDGDRVRVQLLGATTPFVSWTVGTASATVASSALSAPAVAAVAAVAAVPAVPAVVPAVTPRAAPRAPLNGASAVLAAMQVQPSTQPTITVNQADSMLVSDLLLMFSRFSGRNILGSKQVTGKIGPFSITSPLPWDVALRELLAGQGYAAVEDPTTGVIKVDSRANLLQAKQFEPLLSQQVPVNYARAGELANTISGLLARDCQQPGAGAAAGAAPAPAAPAAGASGQGCVVRGKVMADTNTNTLVITEIESAMPDLIRWVQALDVRTPQVSIQAKIIFVDRTDLEDIGLTYDIGSQTQFFNRLVQRTDPSTLQPIDTDGDGVPDAQGGGTQFTPDVNIIDLGGNALSAIANASQQVASPALQLIFSTAMGKFDLTTFLSALQEVRLADQEAKPSITVMDNHEASILVGTETPIRVVTPTEVGGGAVASSSITFKESGIILRVTPHVTNNRQIRLTLYAERSNLTAAASDLGFTFEKQDALTQLLVGDGETAVIGGLTITDVNVSKAGIPILVDLPIIGRLFGETRTQEIKRDLLILVTPRIVDDGDMIRPTAGNQ